jgi:hypothetical protein
MRRLNAMLRPNGSSLIFPPARPSCRLQVPSKNFFNVSRVMTTATREGVAGVAQFDGYFKTEEAEMSFLRSIEQVSK